ncbi:MAG: hypothetical protein AAGJ94_02375 [Pseudomonadota bacterium]
MQTSSTRLPALIRRLASTYDAEVIATVAAIFRVLEAEGRSIHDLADHVARWGDGFETAHQAAGLEPRYADAEEKTETSQTWATARWLMEENGFLLRAGETSFLKMVRSRRGKVQAADRARVNDLYRRAAIHWLNRPDDGENPLRPPRLEWWPGDEMPQDWKSLARALYNRGFSERKDCRECLVAAWQSTETVSVPIAQRVYDIYGEFRFAGGGFDD